MIKSLTSLFACSPARKEHLVVQVGPVKRSKKLCEALPARLILNIFGYLNCKEFHTVIKRLNRKFHLIKYSTWEGNNGKLDLYYLLKYVYTFFCRHSAYQEEWLPSLEAIIKQNAVRYEVLDLLNSPSLDNTNQVLVIDIIFKKYQLVNVSELRIPNLPRLDAIALLNNVIKVCSNLKKVILYKFPLVAIKYFIQKAHGIEHLELTLNNELVDEEFIFLLNALKLQSIAIQSEYLTKKSYQLLSKLQKLVSLKIGDTYSNLTEENLNGLETCTQLKAVTFYNANKEANLKRIFAYLVNVNEINFHRCDGVDDGFLATFPKGLRKMTIHFYNTGFNRIEKKRKVLKYIKPQHIDHLMKYPDLEELTVYQHDFVSAHITKISKLPQLKRLNVVVKNASDLKDLKNCKRLEVLKVEFPPLEYYDWEAEDLSSELMKVVSTIPTLRGLEVDCLRSDRQIDPEYIHHFKTYFPKLTVTIK